MLPSASVLFIDIFKTSSELIRLSADALARPNKNATTATTKFVLIFFTVMPFVNKLLKLILFSQRDLNLRISINYSKLVALELKY